MAARAMYLDPAYRPLGRAPRGMADRHSGAQCYPAARNALFKHRRFLPGSERSRRDQDRIVNLSLSL